MFIIIKSVLFFGGKKKASKNKNNNNYLFIITEKGLFIIFGAKIKNVILKEGNVN